MFLFDYGSVGRSKSCHRPSRAARVTAVPGVLEAVAGLARVTKRTAAQRTVGRDRRAVEEERVGKQTMKKNELHSVFVFDEPFTEKKKPSPCRAPRAPSRRPTTRCRACPCCLCQARSGFCVWGTREGRGSDAELSGGVGWAPLPGPRLRAPRALREATRRGSCAECEKRTAPTE